MKYLTLILTFMLTVFMACQQKQQKTDETKPAQEKAKETTATPDSIMITEYLQGPKKRMNLLQQKVMFRAKKKLADSIVKLQQTFTDSAPNTDNYEVNLRDMRILDEGIRFPDPNDKSTIEVYIQVGIQYKIPVQKVPHNSCKR